MADSTRSDERLYFCCADCGGVPKVMQQRFLAAVLARHRDEHPDHGQAPFSAVVGHASGLDTEPEDA